MVKEGGEIVGRDSSLTANRQPLTAERKELFVKALKGRAEIYTLIGRYADSRIDYQRLKSSFTHNPEIQIEVLLGLGYIYELSGDYKIAIRLYNEAFQISEAKGLPFWKAKTLVYKSVPAINAGNYSAAIEFLDLTLEILSSGGFTDEGMEEERKKIISLALNNKGNAYLRIGEYDKAMKMFKQSIELDKEIGDRLNMAKKLNNIGIIYRRKGEYKSALDYYKKALLISEELNIKYLIMTMFGNIGLTYYYMKIYKNATKYLKSSLSIAKSLGAKTVISSVLLNLGNIYFDKGNLGKAYKLYTESLKIASQAGERYTVAIDLSCIGGIYKKMKKYIKALKYYKRSNEIAEKIGYKFGVAVNLMNMSEILLNQGNLKKGTKLLKKAEMLAKKRGMKPLLEEIERLKKHF